MDDLAPEALTALLPYLAPLTKDAPEQVDGTNPNHPEQTFDYALRRPDGQRLAVEVTRAWDEPFLAARKPWTAMVEHLEGEVRRRSPTSAGRYVVNVDPASSVRVKDHDLSAFVAAVERCVTNGPSSSVTIDEGVTVSNWTLPSAAGMRIYATFSSAEFELGPGSRERLAKALTRKHKTMAKAGAAGYETHLAVIHWAIGSTEGWHHHLAENPPGAPHPQHIWAIDLNVQPGSQGRSPAERLYP